MGFYDEMVDTVQELFAEGDDSFGEGIVITRPGGTYDEATRRRSTDAPQTQAVRGTLDSDLVAVSEASNLTARFERVLTAAPLPTGGFEPGQGDRVVAEGKTWSVEETAHVIKQGKPIVWICGLVST